MMNFLRLDQLCMFFCFTAVLSDNPVQQKVRGFIEEPQKDTREAKRLQLRDGITFLTGFKLGTYLSRNRDYSGQPGSFGLGHGSLSTAHNFRLFGKQVNSALSFTYGDILSGSTGSGGGGGGGGPPLILADDIGSENSTSSFNSSAFVNTTSSSNVNKTSKVSHILVTYLENPSPETLDKITALTRPDYHHSESSFVHGHQETGLSISSSPKSSPGVRNSTTVQSGIISSSTAKPRINSKF